MRMWDKKEDARELSKQGVEVWMPTHLAPTRYFVSNLGRVMSNVANRGMKPMKAVLGNSGRYGVGIYVNAGDKECEGWRIYQLEVWAFDGPPPSADHTDVRHGPSGEKDDRLHNLQWGTRSENMGDVLVHKRAHLADRPKNPVEPSTREWYRGRLADLKAIEVGLKLYDQKKATVEELAAMWGCGVDAAGGVVKGRTLATVGIDLPARSRANGREGEHHHDAVCTDAELAAALKLYTENHWSGVRFAQQLDILQITADSILSGRTRSNVPRPAGFLYPWPDAKYMNKLTGEDHGCATKTNAQILAVFTRIVAGEFKDMKEVQAALGCARGNAYGIVSGREWAHLSRPAGFAEAVEKMQRTILSKEDQTALLAELVAGIDREEAQAKYGLSDSKLAMYVGKANKVLGTQQKRYTSEQRAEIRSLITQGLTREEVNMKMSIELDRSAFHKYKKSKDSK